MKITHIKFLVVFAALSVLSGCASSGSTVTQKKEVIEANTVKVEGNFKTQPDIKPDAKDKRDLYVDLLTVYMRTDWPSDVKTIRQAVNYLLEPTGYTLKTDYPAPREAALLVDKGLPAIAREKRTMPVIDALQMLVGLDHYVVIDRAHHLISFQNSLDD